MVFSVHVKPGSKESKIEAILDETTLKISVAAPAKEGRANKELVRFLSKTLKTAQSNIEIIRGLQTRLKHVDIAGTNMEDIQKTLEN